MASDQSEIVRRLQAQVQAAQEERHLAEAERRRAEAEREDRRHICPTTFGEFLELCHEYIKHINVE